MPAEMPQTFTFTITPRGLICHEKMVPVVTEGATYGVVCPRCYSTRGRLMERPGYGAPV